MESIDNDVNFIPKNIHTLVLEGGGAKGIAFAGVVKALDKYNLIGNITTIVGASAGSMAATIMALGYTSLEMEQILTTTDFNKFRDSGMFGLISDIYDLFKYWGIYLNQYLYDWIGDLIKAKTGNADITFKELQDINGIDLTIVVTNISKSETIYYNANFTPDTIVRFAVRASTSIPVFYKPVIEPITGDLLVDGGLILNYAITKFNKQLDGVMGLRFSNDGMTSPDNKPTKFIDYVINIFQVLMYKESTDIMTEQDWAHTATIQTNVGAIDFGIDMTQKNKLVQAGFDATQDYLYKNGYIGHIL
jgi:NTE family protein